MKQHQLLWFLSLLICVSLSCNFVKEAAPLVDVLPTEIQPAAQPPAEQPPAEVQPPVEAQPPAEVQPPVDQPPAAAQPPAQSTLPVIKNPGFENGFDPWSELPAAIQYGGQSVDENIVSRSGSHSRKLFLRYGGSYILQRIPVDPALPLRSKINLYVYVKMPYAGTTSNKCFTLELVIGDDNGHQQSTKRDQYDALPDWTQLYVLIENSDFPITWIEIHAMTNKGDGIYHNSDRPVYVDDFSLEVFPGQP